VLDLRFCEGGIVCKESKPRTNLRIVCLVNGETSSAAEFFAAALQDNKHAVIVGERTRGKASAQSIECLSKQDYDLCFTTAIFLRPSGKKLDRIRLAGHDADEWGVTPDAENMVQLTQKELLALQEHMAQVAVIRRRDISVKELPAVKDRQLQRAMEMLSARAEPPRY
jgi:carboxyl-terminal processing protease